MLPPEIEEHAKFVAEHAAHEAAIDLFLQKYGFQLGYSLASSPFIRKLVSNVLKRFPKETEAEQLQRIIQNVQFAYGRN